MIIEVNSRSIELPYDVEELTTPENIYKYKQYTISWLDWYGLSEDKRLELLKAYKMPFPEPEDVYEFCIVEESCTNEIRVYLYECTFSDPYEYWREAIDLGVEMTMGKGGRIYLDSLKVINT